MPRSTRPARHGNVIPFPVPPGTSKRLAKRPPEVAPPGPALIPPAPESTQRWFLDTDPLGNDWYLVPADRGREWAELWEDLEWSPPNWAVYAEDVWTVEFSNPTIEGQPVVAGPAKRGRTKGGRSK